MKANCWMGVKSLEVRDVPDPKILNQRDAIVKISSTAICGSDLHLYNGFIPAMEPGDILGHEFMGEVVEVGNEVKNLKVGDRVVVPFPISCGNCWHCQHEMYSLCENSNPNAWMAEKMMGSSPAGIFGYSHLTGGYAGGQAEYARVPFADVGPLKIENGFTDEQVLFLSDIFPTGYMAAEMCGIRAGDTVAVWGCGPVGLLGVYDRSKQMMKLETDRPHALREAIMACRNGGTVSVIGVYSGFIDKFPIGAVMNRSLTIRSGQAHVQHYIRKLFEKIKNDEIDPSFLITHRMRLEDAPEAYDIFCNKENECVKVVLQP
jgi:threonine dehydrogenase-like Zn-dependent dehydrogenase